MPEIQIPSIVITALQVMLAFTGAFFIALWLSLIVWTFRDARQRSRDIFAVLLATLMVIVFGPLGLLLYFLLRPPVTLAELYERSLEEEALLQDLEERPRCPGCSRQVKETWILCPDCHTTLKNICAECKQPLNLTWSLCPYCGTQVGAAPSIHQDHSGSSGQVVYEPEPLPAPQPSNTPTIGYTPRAVPRSDETRPHLPEAGPA
jgi:hypothetical protein